VIAENSIFTVLLEDQDQRLDQWLMTQLQTQSRSRIQELISLGHVELITPQGHKKINIKPSMKVHFGDQINVYIPTPKDENVLIPWNIKLDIIHEDSEIIVINKPAGMVVHPSQGHAQDTLVNAILNHTKDLAIGFNELRPGIVHRLDKETSGLIVIAKTELALKSLSEQFKSKSAGRIYQAIACGCKLPVRGTFKSLLARHPTDRKKIASTTNAEIGKEAVTHYQVLRIIDKISFLQIRLETGRTHQIRVHLSESGHPIVGDEVYGFNRFLRSFPDYKVKLNHWPHIALHARFLELKHPKTEELCRWEAPWPEDAKSRIIQLGFDEFV
jgi:23S rRNA pseudouridine1911/1915/1917 synthase